MTPVELIKRSPATTAYVVVFAVAIGAAARLQDHPFGPMPKEQSPPVIRTIGPTATPTQTATSTVTATATAEVTATATSTVVLLPGESAQPLPTSEPTPTPTPTSSPSASPSATPTPKNKANGVDVYCLVVKDDGILIKVPCPSPSPQR